MPSSRQQGLTTCYDLAHFFSIEGPWISLERVLDYLERAAPRWEPNSPNLRANVIRLYERWKARMRKLGFALETMQDHQSNAWVYFPKAYAAVEHFATMLPPVLTGVDDL